jgi:hypothetical protein
LILWQSGHGQPMIRGFWGRVNFMFCSKTIAFQWTPICMATVVIHIADGDWLPSWDPYRVPRPTTTGTSAYHISWKLYILKETMYIFCTYNSDRFEFYYD